MDRLKEFADNVTSNVGGKVEEVSGVLGRMSKVVTDKLGMGANAEVNEEELRAVFKEFDLDGDSYIQENELKQVMDKMGQSPTDEELRAMFKAADTNNDGKIDFGEFMAIAQANPQCLSLKSVFKELDVDGDGFITRSEMRQAFSKMGKQLSDDEIDTIFQTCDMNKDGKINFDEFVTMMCRKQKAK